MRIGIVTTWFERGAAYVSKQYRDLLAQEHEVFIYARGGESYGIGDPTWDGPKVTWAKKVPSLIPTIVDLKEFKNWLLENHIQIVFFNEQWWWPATILARKLGITTGAYVDYYTKQTVPFFAIYDFLICNTQRHFSAFSWHPGAAYVPWGTDVDVFKPVAPGGVNSAGITFFHSGGINPHRKGCDLVIRAFHALQGNCRLVIHAQRKLRSVFPDLIGIIDELESQGRLECREETVSAPGLFHLGDVYVYPTRLEGIGLTIFESAACGLPVIVTDCGPMNEFITHGHNGRLVQVDRFLPRSDGYFWPQAIVSIDSLIEQMQWYIDNAYHLPEFKARARSVAERDFDWKKASDSVLSVFSGATPRDEAQLESVEEDIILYEKSQAIHYQMNTFEYLKRRVEFDYPLLYQLAIRARALLQKRPHAVKSGEAS